MVIGTTDSLVEQRLEGAHVEQNDFFGSPDGGLA
jgi:hypothetical protein